LIFILLSNKIIKIFFNINIFLVGNRDQFFKNLVELSQ